MLRTDEIFDYNYFNKLVGENLEAQFWGGAPVHAVKFVHDGKWRLLVTSLMEWEGEKYYVVRLRACQKAGGNPSTDVVTTYAEAKNGYAFLDEWEELMTVVERFENSFIGSPWSPEDVDLAGLQEEMVKKISSPTARLATPCEWWE